MNWSFVVQCQSCVETDTLLCPGVLIVISNRSVQKFFLSNLESKWSEMSNGSCFTKIDYHLAVVEFILVPMHWRYCFRSVAIPKSLFQTS